MLACGECAVMVFCADCGAPHLFPVRCRARTCPTCAPKAAAAMAARIQERVATHDVAMRSEPWGGPGPDQKRSWRLVTLTSPADQEEGARWDPEALRRAVGAVGDALPKWWRGTVWGRQVRDASSGPKRARRDTSMAAALEVAPKRGMVHAHLLVYGEFVAQAKLQELWEKALDVPRAIVDVRSVKGDLVGGIREALKYATKGAGPEQVKHAAAVELAFRDRKRVRISGALRAHQGRSAAADSEDVQEADLHDDHEAACEACGTIGGWRYGTLQSRAAVTRNGGWGLLRDGAREGVP